ncbi:unnamed protein product [Rotaria sordida]|uniref:Uncharacterized protein n=1 Tax=Rotaria sordida TaxID=392033 RepID=A0A813SR78_9BILA|nr:unnamed protein product [Rotaria sordida]
MTTTTEQTVINMEQKPAVAHTLVINEPINSQQVSLETVIANEPKNLLATSVEKVAVTDVTTAKPVEADNLIVDDQKKFLQLIIGWRYADNCPANWHIPHYLVVSGVIGLTLIILDIIFDLLASYAKSKLDDTTLRASHCGACCGLCGLLIVIICLILFLVGWFIAGCIWVFRVWNKIQYNDPHGFDYCHPILYRFAFWLLLLSIIYIY